MPLWICSELRNVRLPSSVLVYIEGTHLSMVLDCLVLVVQGLLARVQGLGELVISDETPHNDLAFRLMLLGERWKPLLFDCERKSAWWDWASSTARRPLRCWVSSWWPLSPGWGVFLWGVPLVWGSPYWRVFSQRRNIIWYWGPRPWCILWKISRPCRGTIVTSLLAVDDDVLNSVQDPWCVALMVAGEGVWECQSQRRTTPWSDRCCLHHQLVV